MESGLHTSGRLEDTFHNFGIIHECSNSLLVGDVAPFSPSRGKKATGITPVATD